MKGNQLRVLRLIPTAATSYGSDNYGDNTYGTRVSDVADLQRYEMVPLLGASSDAPYVIHRQSAAWIKFECRLIAFGQEYEGDVNGRVLDLSTVAEAIMWFNKISSGPATQHSIQAIVDDVDDILRVWIPPGNPAVGLHRGLMVVTFDSGRRLTVPGDDSATFLVVDDPTPPEDVI